MNRSLLKGLQLSQVFYEEVVKPILATRFPQLRYSAALIGPGSEVLGFDDAQSTDHDWGPRLQLFLSPEDHRLYRDPINHRLRHELPPTIHGYPTNMAIAGEDGAEQDSLRKHSVTIVTTPGFFSRVLRFDPCGEIHAVDWVMVADYALLSLIRGRVFYDGLGELEAMRARLRYYPHDVWLYLLAAQWKRIAQEEAFMGRCGQVGDELGSRLVATRLVRDLMKLCFLQERQYSPYLKWFGTAFAQLDCAADLLPMLLNITQAQSWQAREEHLSAAYRFVAQKQNALSITAPLAAQVQPYYTRPFQVISADRFVGAIRAAITSAEVLALPAHLGAVDQYLDSTDAFNHLYNGGLQINFQPRSER